MNQKFARLTILITTLLCAVGCAGVGSKGDLIPPTARTAPMVDPALFAWEVEGHFVEARVEFEKPERPNMDVIGGYVDLFEVGVDGKKVNLTKALHQRSHGLFPPGAELELRAVKNGFRLRTHPYGSELESVSLEFDWDANLRN